MDQSGRPVKTVTAMKARQNFGRLLEEVYYKGDQFVIERAGKPMAAVVPLSVLQGWQNRQAPASNSHKRKSKRTG